VIAKENRTFRQRGLLWGQNGMGGVLLGGRGQKILALGRGVQREGSDLRADIKGCETW